jgi:hypothetical protein
MTRNRFKREASGRLLLAAFSSYGNARLIVVRSKVNWTGRRFGGYRSRYAVPFKSGRMVVKLLEGGGGTENNGFIH